MCVLYEIALMGLLGHRTSSMCSRLYSRMLLGRVRKLWQRWVRTAAAHNASPSASAPLTHYTWHEQVKPWTRLAGIVAFVGIIASTTLAPQSFWYVPSAPSSALRLGSGLQCPAPWEAPAFDPASPAKHLLPPGATWVPPDASAACVPRPVCLPLDEANATAAWLQAQAAEAEAASDTAPTPPLPPPKQPQPVLKLLWWAALLVKLCMVVAVEAASGWAMTQGTLETALWVHDVLLDGRYRIGFKLQNYERPEREQAA